MIKHFDFELTCTGHLNLHFLLQVMGQITKTEKPLLIHPVGYKSNCIVAFKFWTKFYGKSKAVKMPSKNINHLLNLNSLWVLKLPTKLRLYSIYPHKVSHNHYPELFPRNIHKSIPSNILEYIPTNIFKSVPRAIPRSMLYSYAASPPIPFNTPPILKPGECYNKIHQFMDNTCE